MYWHQAEDTLIDLSLKINSSVTLGKKIFSKSYYVKKIIMMIIIHSRIKNIFYPLNMGDRESKDLF